MTANVRVQIALIVFATVGSILGLVGCQPSIPKEELGEIVTDIPPELQSTEPYPVPWAKERSQSAGSQHDHPAAEKPAPESAGNLSQAAEVGASEKAETPAAEKAADAADNTSAEQEKSSTSEEGDSAQSQTQ